MVDPGNARGARKLVFVVNHVAFFVSHRLPIAREAMRRGWQVQLLTGLARSDSMEGAAIEELAKAGIPHSRLAFSGSTDRPIRELLNIVRLWWRLRKSDADIVHCASSVGLLYGGIAGRLAGVPSLVLAVSGMGYAFTEDGARNVHRSFLRALYQRAVRFAYGHPNVRVIVQNRDDERWIVQQGLAVSGKVLLIPGSGVDLSAFQGTFESKQKLVVLPARLIKEKGVFEFVEAVRSIRAEVPDWRFLLAGAADYLNPSSIYRETIESWVSEGLVEWPGHVQDIASLLSAASIVCLPSYYREGVPKALLDAAAAGCAVVTTDSVGCREAVIPGRTGDLVPVRDVPELARTILALIRDNGRREAYGRAARLLAAERFSIESVLRDTFALYETMHKGNEVERAWPDGN